MSDNFLTLSQFNALITQVLQGNFPDTYWILAETSDVRMNKNGHCYLELIEKQERGTTILAKNRAYIWSNRFFLLKSFFEEKTGQAFVSGIKVLVKVTPEYHSVYGLGLNIIDIDPTYTLGDMEQRRQEILERLEDESILTLNKELSLAVLPNRIAVITSPTAAGYEDFLDHLTNNSQGFIFYPTLFPAVMQGEQTESSIIKALEDIYANINQFDVVVIIRGGGATSDLTSFDSYALAANCAQFPLPIITGIGHERDNIVLDYISFHRAKTPTAVADYLVQKVEDTYNDLLNIQHNILTQTSYILKNQQEKLKRFRYLFPIHIEQSIEQKRNKLSFIQNKIKTSASISLKNEDNKLQELNAFMKLSSPDYILSRGYSITYKDGKIIKSIEEIKEGDLIQTKLQDGKIESVVEGECSK
jgi:Exonuclease VII, large subunit